MTNLKKLMTIAGLLLLVSCGQPIRNEELQSDTGEEVNVETNFNRLTDIQECLNGDRPSCKRAHKEGFTAFPLFMEDLQQLTIVKVYGQNLTRFKTGTDFVEWKTTIPVTVSNSSYKFRVKLYVRLYDDNGAQITAFYNVKYSSSGSWSSDKNINLTSGSSTEWRNQIEPWTNLIGTHEWSSDSFNSLEIDGSLLEVIARQADEE